MEQNADAKSEGGSDEEAAHEVEDSASKALTVSANDSDEAPPFPKGLLLFTQRLQQADRKRYLLARISVRHDLEMESIHDEYSELFILFQNGRKRPSAGQVVFPHRAALTKRNLSTTEDGADDVDSEEEEEIPTFRVSDLNDLESKIGETSNEVSKESDTEVSTPTDVTPASPYTKELQEFESHGSGLPSAPSSWKMVRRSARPSWRRWVLRIVPVA